MKTQQFTVEQYQAAKVVAKELGINAVGKTKQTLVDLVNAQLKPVKEAPKAKWFAKGYGFQPTNIVVIEGKTIYKNGVVKDILQGRFASIVGPSINEGFVKAFLFDEKTGEILNCPITLDINRIQSIETQLQVA